MSSRSSSFTTNRRLFLKLTCPIVTHQRSVPKCTAVKLKKKKSELQRLRTAALPSCVKWYSKYSTTLLSQLARYRWKAKQCYKALKAHDADCEAHFTFRQKGSHRRFFSLPVRIRSLDNIFLFLSTRHGGWQTACSNIRVFPRPPYLYLEWFNSWYYIATRCIAYPIVCACLAREEFKCLLDSERKKNELGYQ